MSPIHDQSYRHYQGSREPLGRAWAVIAGAGIRGMFSRKLFLILMIVSWIPFVVRGVGIYILEVYPQAGQIIAADAGYFQDFLNQQGIWVYLVTIYVGSGLIAHDRRANALQIYLSKPMLRTEYIGGKLSVLAFFLLLITLLPALLLVVLQLMFSGGFDLIRTDPQVVPAVILSSLVTVTVASCTMLALSSLSKSTRYVAVLYTGAIFFTSIMFGVLAFVSGSTRVAWVSILANLELVSDALFRQEMSYETPLTVSALVLIGLVVFSISVLERRVRGVEIVS
jgi:ABC-type transport system involved in multi-copper enzyme maturation permease subunit